MEITEFTFRLMLLGIPGICCYFLLKKLIGKIGADITESVLSIFVLSIFCYLAADIFSILPHLLPCLPWHSEATDFGLIRSLLSDSKLINDKAILVTTLFSAPVAGLVSILYRKKIWNRLCQKLKLTNRFGDEDVFNYLLDAERPDTLGWFIVRDHKEELVYYGAITAWSDEGRDRELTLSEVDVYSNEGDGKMDKLYSCPTLYLCRKRDDITIELT